jgi:predicted nucleic acid-binding protein
MNVAGEGRVMPDVPPVVVDTNVFVAAGFNPGRDAARVLAAVRAGSLRLVWDDATRREVEYILGKIPPLSGADLSGLFRQEDRYGGPTRLEEFDDIPDPADRKFATLAAAAGAVLLTRDRHLLIGRPRGGPVILTPAESVRRAWPDGAGG